MLITNASLEVKDFYEVPLTLLMHSNRGQTYYLLLRLATLAIVAMLAIIQVKY